MESGGVMLQMRPAQSADQASATASHARRDGAQAGRLGLSPSLNPHPMGSDAYKQWFQGWFEAVTSTVALRNAEAARARLAA